MAVWLYVSRVQIVFSIVFLAAEIMFLSARLCKFDFEIQRNRSFMKTLNKIEPRIDLWGSPENKI